MSLDLTDCKSTLVQVMAWCHQATNHYQSQCWPIPMSPYGSLGPNELKFQINFQGDDYMLIFKMLKHQHPWENRLIIQYYWTAHSKIAKWSYVIWKAYSHVFIYDTSSLFIFLVYCTIWFTTKVFTICYIIIKVHCELLCVDPSHPRLPYRATASLAGTTESHQWQLCIVLLRYVHVLWQLLYGYCVIQQAGRGVQDIYMWHRVPCRSLY